MGWSKCKKCGTAFNDDIIWANNCVCPACGANDWEDLD